LFGRIISLYDIIFSKAINKVYEEFVLTEGDFDERVFLCDEADVELGTPIKGQPFEVKREAKRDLTAQLTVVCIFLAIMGKSFCYIHLFTGILE